MSHATRRQKVRAVALSILFPLTATASEPMLFPANFLWGASTAAHQVEGNGLDNDWSRFEQKPGKIKNGDKAVDGVDHYRRYDEDFGLAESMGHNAHRFSIEWSRIEPKRGEWDLKEVEHYRDVLRSLKRHGIKPMVTLFHFTLPLWAADQGGWLSNQTLRDFERFSAFMAEQFGGEIDHWITINEPNAYAFLSHANGEWPPEHKSNDEALQVMAQLSRAHVAAYHAIHAKDPNAQVGIAQHIAVFEPYSWWSLWDRLHAYFNDQVFNRSVYKAVTTGEFDFWFPGATAAKSYEPQAKNALDFIGVNYYTRWLCQGDKRVANADARITGMGWEVYPEGLLKSLELADDYTRLSDGRKIPIYITENGYEGEQHDERSAYLVQHVEQIAQAIRQGIDVRGYIHWTLMDNFEWNSGYQMHFGLYTVDRNSGSNFWRIPTPTVDVFRRIATTNGLTPDLIQQFGRETWVWKTGSNRVSNR